MDEGNNYTRKKQTEEKYGRKSRTVYKQASHSLVISITVYRNRIVVVQTLGDVREHRTSLVPCVAMMSTVYPEVLKLVWYDRVVEFGCSSIISRKERTDGEGI